MARYRDTSTGEILSEEQFNALPSAQDTGERFGKPLTFGERFRLSFGGKKEIEELKTREEEAGLRGKFDIGDIADVAGSSLPAVGSFIGGVAGAIGGGLPTLGVGAPVGAIAGSGIGAAAGEGVKRTVGQLLGVRGSVTPTQEAVGTIASGVGTAVLGKTLQLGGRYVASRLPKLLGLFTGETEVVNAALSNPRVADIGIKQGDSALRNAIQAGSQQSIKVRDAFIQGQSQAMDQVFSGTGATRGFASSMKQKAQKAFADILKSNRVGIDRGGLNFITSPVKANPGETSKVIQAYEAVQKWTDWSPRGIHNLKQLVGRLTKFPTEAGGTSKSPVLGSFYSKLNEQVTEGLPKARVSLYRAANKRFEDSIDLFDDLVSAFNSGDPFTRLSQIFGKNKDTLRMLMQFYKEKTGEDILALQAGRELAAERSAAFGFLNPREWIDLFIDPKLQARLVTGAGRFQEASRRFFPIKGRDVLKGTAAEEIQRRFNSPAAE